MLSAGRTEFIEKYFEVIGELLGRGFSVLVHDWRGQGLSDAAAAGRAEGPRRPVRRFRRRLSAACSTTSRTALPKPWIALSHSMGGCLTMLALARGERRFSGAILSAPMLGLTAAAAAGRCAPAVWLMDHLGRGRTPMPSAARPTPSRPPSRPTA